MIEGTYKIEYKINHDGRNFVNFWDVVHGNDVLCEYKNGRLYHIPFDEAGNELPEKEVSFAEVLEMIRQTISDQQTMR